MPEMSYVLFQQEDGQLQFVEMPASHAYQLSALNLRLHKELSKLTADNVPQLPKAIAEFRALDLLDENRSAIGGLTYVNELEQTFSSIREGSYPLISLLTEIRALQAQLEQWYEDEDML
ncbi:hydrolase/acyltransferase [Cohnella cholangitidis]|uniref:Hydrolase/acyltransferase n=1 Tax=Cohnella cholangitidis TaxID=2598458 RepID=A0A7G5C259_9BACL|nr:hydrolase/acyltransferase [Cohnella cholangitidis]QMV43293.1 hydrolase/acyltransferase [Cohnella cholangitidis]